MLESSELGPRTRMLTTLASTWGWSGVETVLAGDTRGGNNDVGETLSGSVLVSVVVTGL